MVVVLSCVTYNIYKLLETERELLIRLDCSMEDTSVLGLRQD